MSTFTIYYGVTSANMVIKLVLALLLVHHTLPLKTKSKEGLKAALDARRRGTAAARGDEGAKHKEPQTRPIDGNDDEEEQRPNVYQPPIQHWEAVKTMFKADFWRYVAILEEILTELLHFEIFRNMIDLKTANVLLRHWYVGFERNILKRLRIDLDSLYEDLIVND